MNFKMYLDPNTVDGECDGDCAPGGSECDGDCAGRI